LRTENAELAALVSLREGLLALADKMDAGDDDASYECALALRLFVAEKLGRG
jgi:hypothetical protein